MEAPTATSNDTTLLPITEMTTMNSINSTPTGMLKSMKNLTTNPELQVSTAFWVFYYSIKFLFTSFAILGNMLTITAVARFERLQTNTSYLICSLAVADMLGCLQAPTDLAHELLKDRLVFVPLCLIHTGIGSISLYMTICSILGIAIDRYILIAHPLHYPRLVTSHRTYAAIAVTWAVIVAEISTIFIVTNDMEVGKECNYSDFIPKLVQLTILTPQLNVLVVLTVGFYIAIGRIAHKQGLAIALLNYSTHEATLNRSHKKIAKMMVTVLGVSLLCNSPMILGTVFKLASTTIFWLYYEKITALMYWLNIWLNPLIYAWKSEDFRKAFRKLLGLKPVTLPYQI